MEPKVLERALHSWEKWLVSIDHGRKLLRSGESKTTLQEMRSAAAQALAELGFQPCTIFQLYWLCCVFSDYQTGSGSFMFEKLVVPNWFPLPFGFEYESWLENGTRIYPPNVWTEADVKFWRNRDPLVRYMPRERVSKYLAENYPNRDFVILLPPDHPVRQFVKRGRPGKTKTDGETWL